MELPHFRAVLNRAEARAIDECIRHLVRMATPAAVIAQILRDEDAPHYVRLRAAVSAVDALLKLKQFNHLLEAACLNLLYTGRNILVICFFWGRNR